MPQRQEREIKILSVSARSSSKPHKALERYKNVVPDIYRHWGILVVDTSDPSNHDKHVFELYKPENGGPKEAKVNPRDWAKYCKDKTPESRAMSESECMGRTDMTNAEIENLCEAWCKAGEYNLLFRNCYTMAQFVVDYVIRRMRIEQFKDVYHVRIEGAWNDKTDMEFSLPYKDFGKYYVRVQK